MRLLNLETIVVATDLDATSHVALGAAYRLATAAGAALHVLHVAAADGGAASAGRVPDGAADAVREALATVNVPAGDVGIHVIPGSPAETIRSFADRMSADVVVVGPHRERDRVTRGHLLGGTARAVVEQAYAPCLIAAHPLRLPLERVLVPTDLSDTARGALLVGLSWASGLRASATDDDATTLTALHVVSPGDAGGAGDDDTPASLDRELELVRGGPGTWSGITLEGRLERGGNAAQVIGRTALDSQADLVVIGTRGRGADDVARLGSVSASVTMHVQVPTLLVPPGVWRTAGT